MLPPWFLCVCFSRTAWNWFNFLTESSLGFYQPVDAMGSCQCSCQEAPGEFNANPAKAHTDGQPPNFLAKIDSWKEFRVGLKKRKAFQKKATTKMKKCLRNLGIQWNSVLFFPYCQGKLDPETLTLGPPVGFRKNLFQPTASWQETNLTHIKACLYMPLVLVLWVQEWW